MAINITKYTEYVPWDAVGVGATRHGGGGGGGISDLSIYVTPDPQFPIDYLYYMQNGIETYVTDIPKADGVVSGGIVSWITGLQFQLSPTAYYIDGVLYMIVSDTVTLDPADDTFGRFDILVVDTSLNFTFVKGVASAEPLKPTPDPLTQLELTSIYIPANAVEPEPLPTDEFIYDENDSGEWFQTASGVTVDWAGVVDPYIGTYCIDVGALTNGDYLQFEAGSSLDRADYETIILNLKLKATIPTTSNRMVLTFLLDGVPVSSQYTLSFDRSITSWQNIGVSFGAITWSGTSFNQVRFTWIRSGGGSYTGIYLDYIKLETNIEQPPIQQSIELMGDVNGSGLTGSPVITSLVTIVGLTAGQYGDATHIPMVTVDVKGRVTAIETVEISIPEANTFDMSLSEDSLGVVTLLNDEDSPGNSKYYGTDAGGTKGWYDLPESGASLWEESPVGFLSPVSSAGMGINVGNIFVDGSIIYTADGHLQHLTIQAGEAVGTGNDGGNLILKAGDAIWGDATSTKGDLYLVPGNGNQASDNATIYLGDANTATTSMILSAAASASNINLSFLPKGTGSLTFGRTTTVYVTMYGTNSVAMFTPALVVGLNVDSYVSGCAGNVSHPTGYNFTIKGGAGRQTGDTTGGNLLLYGGDPWGAGIRGDVYFGTGAAGYLKEADSDQEYVVYYDTATGLLSYGYVGTPGSPGGYTFSMSLAESGGTVTLDNDEESPGNSQYYGTDDTGVKGWYDLPESGASLWEESPAGFLSPVSSAGMGINVGNVFVDGSTIYTAPGHLSHLYIQAGNASGTGNDGGYLILKAGNSINGDSASAQGVLYLVPGNNYRTDMGAGYIYLGDDNFAMPSISFSPIGTQTNIGISFVSKGTGIMNFGTTNNIVNFNGASSNFYSTVQLYTNLVFMNDDRIISGSRGVSRAGYNLTVKGGPGWVSGDWNGGNLLLYGGDPTGAGLRGDVYIGTGAAGYLKAATTETYVVYYDTTTGKLSYGYVGEPGSPGGYTFAMSIDQASDDTVTLVNDADTPGNSKYYGTDDTGVKGWFDLPDSSGSLWEEDAGGYLTPLDSDVLGILVGAVYVRDSEIYTAAGHNADLTIQAGDALGTGNDAGDLILKAGDAISADTGSLAGNLYLTPGSGYDASHYGYIYLGDTNYSGNKVFITTAGTSANIALEIRQKGASALIFGDGSATSVTIYGASMTVVPSTTFMNTATYFGYHTDAVLAADSGWSSHVDGHDMTLKGGNARSSGTDPYNGGNVYIYGGDKRLTGFDGNIYFGTGSVGKLPEADSEDTCVVRYNPTTGKLSYAAV